MKQPSVSIVIPTLNRSTLLSRCLIALFTQTINARDYEIIVVDDGSSDDTQSVLSNIQAPCTFRYLRQPHSGAASARNSGLSQSRGQIVLFIDDDIIADSQLVNAHLSMHKRFPRSAVIGRVYTVAHGFHPALDNVFARLNERQLQIIDRSSPLSPFDLLTGNFSIEIDLLIEVGSFDSSLPSDEDFELGLRLLDRGIKILYCPEATAQEHYTRSIDVFWAGAYRRGLAHALIAQKHPRAATLLDLKRFFQGPLSKRFARKLMWSLACPGGTLHTATRSTKFKKGLARNSGRLPAALYRLVAGINYWCGVRHGFGSLSRFHRFAWPKLLVLGYHMLDDVLPAEISSYCVDPEKFQRQMTYLYSRGYRTISFNEWVLGLAGKLDLPEKPIAITFDDGYRDTLTQAWPRLRVHGFRAAVFLVANAIGRTNVWDEAIGLPSRQLLSKEEINRILSEMGEVGSHGLTHSKLPTLPKDELTQEVHGSKAILERELDIPINFFAYPYGNFNSRTIAEIKAAGYVGACCSLSGVNNPRTNIYAIRRMFISNKDGSLRFALKIRFAGYYGLITDLKHLAVSLGRWILR